MMPELFRLIFMYTVCPSSLLLLIISESFLWNLWIDVRLKFTLSIYPQMLPKQVIEPRNLQKRPHFVILYYIVFKLIHAVDCGTHKNNHLFYRN